MNASGTVGKQEAQPPKTAQKENPGFNDPLPLSFWGNQEAEIIGMKLASGLSMKINSKISHSGLMAKHKALASCQQGEGLLYPKADHRAFRELGFIWSHVTNHTSKDSGLTLVFSLPQ